MPLIANVQPAGEHLTERLMTAGGVPAPVTLDLEGRLQLSDDLGEDGPADQNARFGSWCCHAETEGWVAGTAGVSVGVGISNTWRR